MWKNVIINFLVLSFIVFSGEYLHYQIKLKNALKNNTDEKVDPLQSDISGALYNNSHAIVISGVSQPSNAMPFHICGIETADTRVTIEITPAKKVTPNNLLTTTSS